jgi:hypothetical protein
MYFNLDWLIEAQMLLAKIVLLNLKVVVDEEYILINTTNLGDYYLFSYLS